MSLHVRQLGWLHAVPQPQPGPRQRGPAPPPDRRTRLRRLQDDGRQPQLVPLAAEAYLLSWLWDMGAADFGGGGRSALRPADILAWQSLSGVRLTPWEARTVRAASAEYLAGLAAGEDPASPMPVAHAPDPATLAARRKQVAQDTRAALRGAAARRA